MKRPLVMGLLFINIGLSKQMDFIETLVVETEFI